MANNATSCSHALGCNMHWAIYNNIYNRLQSLNVLHQAATIQWAAAMHWAALCTGVQYTMRYNEGEPMSCSRELRALSSISECSALSAGPD
eukprot:1137804-Pelagomonas_calceolata.AAC.1